MLVLAAAVLNVWTLLHLSRDTTFFYDEWYLIQEAGRGGPFEGLLAPGNGHLGVVGYSVYRLLFYTVGLDVYFPYRIVVVALHVTAVGLFYLYARRRVGDWAAAILTLPLFFFGSGWQMMLWPAGMSYIIPVAAGIGMLLALDREDVLGDVGASIFLALAIGTSGVGLPIAAAAAIELLRRPHRRTRMLALGLPIILFLLWYAVYNPRPAVSSDDAVSFTATLDYFRTAAAAGVAGLFQGDEWQGLLAGLMIGGIAFSALVRQPRASGRLIALVSVPLVFWGLTALARTGLGTPGASRYLYPAGFWLLLILVEGLRGRRMSKAALLVAAAAIGLILIPHLDLLMRGAGGLRTEATIARAELGAVELVSRHLAPDFAPDLRLMPNVRVAPYLRAVAKFGSPADQASEILREPEGARAAADEVLIRGLRIQAQSVGSDLVDGRPRDCELLIGSGATSADLILPSSGLVFEGSSADVEVRLRRFRADYPPEPFVVVGEGDIRSLTAPGDASTQEIPWMVTVTSVGPVRLCR